MLCVDSRTSDDYSMYGNKDSDNIVYNDSGNYSMNSSASPSRQASVNAPSSSSPLSRHNSASAPSSSTGRGGGGGEVYDTYEGDKAGVVEMNSNPLRAMALKKQQSMFIVFIMILLF